MSKERELLRRISSHSESRIPAHFIYELKELLAQPEPEPVNFDLERMKLAVESPVSDVTVEGLIDKVKSNREHIVDVGNMVEPVAWMYEWYENDLESTQAYCGSEKPFKGEIKQPFNLRPLYIAPPKREPLSDEEIFDIGYKAGFAIDQDESADYESDAYGFLNGDGYVDNEPYFKLVKAIEKAHGIGEKNDPS